jgi:quinol monooxygenase YgiN
MFFNTIRMAVNPNKRKELLQTIKALLEDNRKKSGCVSSQLYQDLEDESVLYLVEAWGSREELDDYLRSNHFGVLLGAMTLLRETPEIKLNEVSRTGGVEVIRAVRGIRNQGYLK